MSDTEITAAPADAPSNESVPAAPAIDYKALATEMLAQQKEAEEAAKVEADRIAAEEAAKPKTFTEEEVKALVAAAAETTKSEADAAAQAIEDARRSGKIDRVGHTTEAAVPYYEAVAESEEAQRTFLGKLDNAELAKYIGAVAADDRNLMGLAPRLAANSR